LINLILIYLSFNNLKELIGIRQKRGYTTLPKNKKEEKFTNHHLVLEKEEKIYKREIESFLF